MDCEYNNVIQYVTKWILIPMAASLATISLFLFWIMLELTLIRTGFEKWIKTHDTK